MEPKDIQKRIKEIWNNRYIFLWAVAIVFGILYLLFSYHYQNLEDDLIREYDFQVGNFTKHKENWDEERTRLVEDKEEYIRLKNEIQDELNVCKINSGGFNLTINNENALTTTEFILNSSCLDKEIIIGELIDKINSQDTSIKILNNKSKELEKINANLEEKIPNEIKEDFTGKDISVSVGGFYQADNGKLTLSVTKNNNDPPNNSFFVVYRINGKQYSTNLGEHVTFTHEDGFNYTVNIVSTNNPSVFYFYKN